MTVKDKGMILSTLWIFVTLNYLYCDVLSLMSPEMLNSLISTGGVDGMTMDEPTLLGAAVLLEIPILLVLLSRILKHKANRLANIIGGSIMTLVMAGTLLMGGSLHYIFFAIIEIATTSFIVWFSWTWTEPEAAESLAKNGAHTAA
ncbi:DUF6326 family protein [Microbulbifer hainanensis]|uniref:DUF6326 family protein n=1 Tax=Microbulbifer hainanensis TaxID=2735675 RepID=UPI001867C6DC|nr:DUF6326 family protein [Microbulbifer hainanensis]